VRLKLKALKIHSVFVKCTEVKWLETWTILSTWKGGCTCNRIHYPKYTNYYILLPISHYWIKYFNFCK